MTEIKKEGNYKKIILKIEGMHCASCAVSIENVLKKEQGILSANVNFASENLYLEFDSSKIDLSRIKDIVKDLGYKAVEKTNNIESHDHHKKINDKDLKKLKRKFIFALVFSLPIVYMSLGEMISLPMLKVFENYGIVIQFILTTLVIISALDIWRSGFKGLLKGRPNMDSLVFIGTAAAYFYSLIISILIFLEVNTEYHLYYEGTVLILVFISLGKYLEAITKGQTSEAVKKLAYLQPKEARVIRSGKEIKVSISEVKIGDIILVGPGEKIPVDSIVIDGYSAVDEKVITGESIPVEKKKDDKVIGATINKTGVLKIKAVKVGEDTVLSQIIKIVEEAIESKAPIQILADKISFYFVPSVIVIAILSFIVWILVGQSFTFALTIFVSVLIIACPCALGLATPTAVMVGTGLAAENGILIKNSKALEAARNINIVVFDKTGTLTKGEPVVTDIIKTRDKIDGNYILQIAASVEKNSEHPLAQAVVNKAKEKKINFLMVKNFQAIPGYGVFAEAENKKNFLGAKKLMIKNQIDLSPVEEIINKLENEGKTTMLLAQDKKIIGIIAVADTLKEYSKETVKTLLKTGQEVAIITGDNEKVAQFIAKQLGIKKVLAEVLPQEKLVEIKKLQSEGYVVAMVGDGINDAPALVQADLGISLGAGTDIAREAGEIILINDDLRGVVMAIDLSRYTFNKIKQNLFWAFFYNVVSIPIAAGVLYPFTGWLLSPVIASAAMAFSSVSVVLNSLLMKKYQTKIKTALL